MAQGNFKSLKGVKKNEPLAKYTTFKIGGPADWFYQAKTTEEVVKAVRLCRQQEIPFFVLGGGSNVLVSDEGFRGMVIKMGSLSRAKSRDEKWEACPERSRGMGSEMIITEAGVPLAKIIKVAEKNSLSGLEFAAGIPGTVGGAVWGNAGAWQQSISEIVTRVKILTENGKTKWINRVDCQFTYRQSRFKRGKEVILEVELCLTKGDKNEIRRKIKINLTKRNQQPTQPSSGCIFINPKPKSAGELIEKCGLKGKRIGNAQISEKHANFIVNLGGAKAADVVKLIVLAREAVREKFGINLKPEIVILDEYGDQIHY
jgi:UDP-N-acetylmuramate dehydrogenase